MPFIRPKSQQPSRQTTGTNTAESSCGISELNLPETLTRAQMAEALGVDNSALARWKKSCPLKFGEPLLPQFVPSEVSGELVEGYSKETAQTLLKNQRALKSGRFVDEEGEAWLSTTKTLKSFVDVQPNLSEPTLLRWFNKGLLKRYPNSKLPGVWYREREVLAWRDTLMGLKEGRYRVDGRECLTPKGIKLAVQSDKEQAGKKKGEASGWPCLKTIFKKLDPIETDNLRGGGSRNPREEKVDPGTKRVVSKKDLEQLRAKAKSKDSEEYDDGARVTVAKAARILGVSDHMVRIWIKEGVFGQRDEPDGPAWRTHPRGIRARRKLTLLKAKVQKKREERLAQREVLRLPGQWETLLPTLDLLGLVDPSERAAASGILTRLAEARIGLAEKMYRREGQLRRVWHYNIPKLKAYLEEHQIDLTDWATFQDYVPRPATEGESAALEQVSLAEEMADQTSSNPCPEGQEQMGSDGASLDPASERRRKKRGERGLGKETQKKHDRIRAEWATGEYESHRELASKLDVSRSLVSTVLGKEDGKEDGQKKSPC